ncbi:MAG TPA: MFS transporter, partial [Brevundimonas sp.]|uniref:MFS transporter n=1 Tax=Brevundimonas sp. TaxID=1871086 RepID=UPI002C80A0E1
SVGAFAVLEWMGFQAEAGAVNTPAVITGLSWLFIAVPAVLLFLTAWVVRRYPLTEAAHLEVRTELTRRGR